MGPVARAEPYLTFPPRWWVRRWRAVPLGCLQAMRISSPGGVTTELYMGIRSFALSFGKQVWMVGEGGRVVRRKYQFWILLRPYNPDSFSCEGQDYGYYADVESACEVC